MPKSVGAVEWSPSSWQRKTQLQLPEYGDSSALENVLRRLAVLPPLVTSWEVERLKEQLAEAAAGRRFVLQGGDCAERLEECEPGAIARKLKILLQMSLVLVYGLRMPVIRVGRLAGQYAKPRSAADETIGGITLPAYRGDIVNRPSFTERDRLPDPRLMLDAYHASGLTLNFVRALTMGGFADLHHPEYWNLKFLSHSSAEGEYRQIVQSLSDGLKFMETIHEAPIGGLERVEFYTSHEALLLPYEQALTRRVPRRVGMYNLSTHFPWIGMRTTSLESSHIEYARGLENPIALKVGPSMQASELVTLLEVLNPEHEQGHITLISRFGVDQIEDHLPRLVEAVRASGVPVLWCCDPMHGNTIISETGRKTRRFDSITGELQLAFAIHASAGSRLGGVHIELTGDDVTECTGGARGLSDVDLDRSYRSQVDPRLNGEQALELAFDIVHHQS
jgi:3-deoxy-7-phosphoheptulonate synthase